jgi:hypothetical protein
MGERKIIECVACRGGVVNGVVVLIEEGVEKE